MKTNSIVNEFMTVKNVMNSIIRTEPEKMLMINHSPYFTIRGSDDNYSIKISMPGIRLKDLVIDSINSNNEIYCERFHDSSITKQFAVKADFKDGILSVALLKQKTREVLMH